MLRYLVDIITLTKMPLQTLKISDKVGESNFSYVRKNCLQSHASNPYIVTFLRPYQDMDVLTFMLEDLTLQSMAIRNF